MSWDRLLKRPIARWILALMFIMGAAGAAAQAVGGNSTVEVTPSVTVKEVTMGGAASGKGGVVNKGSFFTAPAKVAAGSTYTIMLGLENHGKGEAVMELKTEAPQGFRIEVDDRSPSPEITQVSRSGLNTWLIWISEGAKGTDKDLLITVHVNEMVKFGDHSLSFALTPVER